MKYEYHTEKFGGNSTIIGKAKANFASFASNYYTLENKMSVLHRIEWRGGIPSVCTYTTNYV